MAMSTGRILVIDDDADQRELACKYLTDAGYDVVEADDGERGIHAMQNAASHQKVDVIVCDLSMPIVNGWEAIAYFRAHFPSVPVIVLTGKGDITSVLTSFEMKTVNYLVKPVEPEKLTEAVAKAMAKRS